MATIIYLVSCVIYTHCKRIINLLKQKTWRFSDYQSLFSFNREKVLEDFRNTIESELCSLEKETDTLKEAEDKAMVGFNLLHKVS